MTEEEINEAGRKALIGNFTVDAFTHVVLYLIRVRGTRYVSLDGKVMSNAIAYANMFYGRAGEPPYGDVDAVTNFVMRRLHESGMLREVTPLRGQWEARLVIAEEGKPEEMAVARLALNGMIRFDFPNPPPLPHGHVRLGDKITHRRKT